MIACICQRITDAEVKEACKTISKPEQLHEHCGKRRTCGQCLFYIEELMEKERGK